MYVKKIDDEDAGQNLRLPFLQEIAMGREPRAEGDHDAPLTGGDRSIFKLLRICP